MHESMFKDLGELEVGRDWLGVEVVTQECQDLELEYNLFNSNNNRLKQSQPGWYWKLRLVFVAVTRERRKCQENFKYYNSTYIIMI